MSDERDTLPGTEPVPPASSSPPTEPDPLKAAVRQAVREVFAPVAGMWDRRSEDMLAVLADATAARVEVHSAVRMIKLTLFLKVAIVLGASAIITVVLDSERQERRRSVMMQEERRELAIGIINAHVDAVCRRR